MSAESSSTEYVVDNESEVNVVEVVRTEYVQTYEGTVGPQGPTGPQGPAGADGDDGVGLPTGGSAGQVLEKASGTDYDFTWATPAGSGDMLKSVYDTANITEQVVGLTATQTLTNKTLTTPTITRPTLSWFTGEGAQDTNGNWLFRVNEATSAVNYLRIWNSATGFGAKLSVDGSDSNVDLILQPKGTGQLYWGSDVVSVEGHSHTESDISDLQDYAVGPASATDNYVPRFDGTTGKLLQSSTVRITDGGDIELLTPTANVDGRDVSADGATLDALDSNALLDSDLLDEDDMSSDSSTNPASQQSIKAYIASEISDAKSELYPVGVIYTNITGTNPATELGFGTWSAFGAGRVPVGYDSGDTDFDTAEETGGSKTHTLTVDEIPSHNHEKHLGRKNSGTSKDSRFWAGTTGTSDGNVGYTGDTGGGNAHTIVQPYIVVHMWKRTA